MLSVSILNVVNKPFVLSDIIMLNVVILSFIMLSVVMLNVVVPLNHNLL
jgi:hypothetical protein